jgi:orotate phosphoribosyltransferase
MPIRCDRLSQGPRASPPDQIVTRRIAETLVRTGAVAFRTSPFYRLTSGVESPVYVDNRQLLGHVAERLEVVGAFVETLTAQLAPEAIAGTATAGIPWGAWLADRLSLPFMYVRSQAKAWGKESAVEGTAPEGARVLVVEDLAFSAGSVAAAAENLRAAGFLVEDALTIASYDMPSAHARMQALGLRHTTLTTIDEALAAAARARQLDDRQVSVVEDWLRERRAAAIATEGETA